MTGILLLPDETLLHVLQSCEHLTTAIKLAATCKTIHSVFASNLYSIAHKVGTTDILAFQDAFRAARATNLVLESFRKGELPPDPFPLDSLNVRARGLSLEELRQLFDWQHLVECIENICLKNFYWGEESESKREESPEDWPMWRESFHRSMYRVFFIGAVLCGTYQKPFDPAVKKKYDAPPDLLEQFQNRRLRNDEMAYLMKFPVFHFMSHENQKPAYDPLANFLSNLSATRVPDNPPCKDLLSPEELSMCELDASHASILHAETMQTMFSFMQLWYYYGGSDILKECEQECEGQAHNPSIVVVLPAQFYPEEVLMPSRVEDACQTLLPTKPVAPSPDTHNSYSSWMSRVLRQMHINSGQPNHYADKIMTASPPLQVFEYIWCKFLGHTITLDAFDENFPDTAFKLFLEGIDAGDVYFALPHAWSDGAFQMVGLPWGEDNIAGLGEPYFDNHFP